jgi:hypothetical protein
VCGFATVVIEQALRADLSRRNAPLAHPLPDAEQAAERREAQREGHYAAARFLLARVSYAEDDIEQLYGWAPQ